MNGYTKDPALYERLTNLIEQIPMEQRCAAVSDCMPLNGNPHDLERELTGYCLRKAWRELEVAEPVAIRPFDHDDESLLSAARACGFLNAALVRNAIAEDADYKDLKETQEYSRL